MAGFLSGKLKRKDLEEVYDEFSEFSLNSPARKIRRLDAELPPIMEEEEPAVPLLFEQQMPKAQMSGNVLEFESVMDEAVPPFSLNEERALVLYKPVNTPLVSSPSSPNVSFKVNSDFIHGFKNQILFPGNSNPMRGEEEPMYCIRTMSNNSLAVVPWVPTQAPSTTYGNEDTESRSSLLEESMQAEAAAGGALMEVEEDKEQAGSSGVGEDFHHWQQHCMTPQLPQNTTTPIMSSWR